MQLRIERENSEASARKRHAEQEGFFLGRGDRHTRRKARRARRKASWRPMRARCRKASARHSILSSAVRPRILVRRPCRTAVQARLRCKGPGTVQTCRTASRRRRRRLGTRIIARRVRYCARLREKRGDVALRAPTRAWPTAALGHASTAEVPTTFGEQSAAPSREKDSVPASAVVSATRSASSLETVSIRFKSVSTLSA